MRFRMQYIGSRKELGLTNYIAERRKTGICEICGHTIEGHPQCEACGILCGGKHLSSLEEYQGHELCWDCVETWKKKEEAGEVIDLHKFRWPTGIPVGRPRVRKVKVAIRPVGRPSKEEQI